MAATASSRFAILLRADPKPWEMINSFRVKYPSLKDVVPATPPDRTWSETRLPYIPFVPKLPPSSLEEFQKELPAFASLQKPFSVEVKNPFIMNRHSPEEYGLAWALDVEWKKFQYLVPEEDAFTRKAFGDPRDTASLTIRTSTMGMTKAQAEEALSDLQGSNHGLKSIDLLGFALQPYTRGKSSRGRPGVWGLRITEERMLGQYAFGAESQS
ncbi:hypothetical protein BUE80_DR001198 [Diplocarpon rosae]|nr:hypothetical protein BUE80_DR001198 [Diplocarpon rosae]